MPSLLTRSVSTAAAAAAAVAARRAAETGWRLWHGDAPPHAADVASDTDLRDLLVWSLILIGAVEVARRLASAAAGRLLGDDEA